MATKTRFFSLRRKNEEPKSDTLGRWFTSMRRRLSRKGDFVPPDLSRQKIKIIHEHQQPVGDVVVRRGSSNKDGQFMQRANGSIVLVVSENSEKERLPSSSALERYRALYRSSSVPTRQTAPAKNRRSLISRMSRKLSHKPKRIATTVPDDPGNDGDVSEVSSLSRERSFSNRRRWFAHHDCESTAFDFVPISRLLDSSSKRSVIASGASAAIFTSALASEVGSEEELRRLQGTIKVDKGCGRSNRLVASCPQFRNEIGGENALRVASVRPEHIQRGSHIPQVDCGRAAALFEDCGRPTSGFLVECPTPGQDYYRKYFLNFEHANYICLDERYGPVCVSIRREKPEERSRKDKSLYIYRIIVRTASLVVLKGSVLEEMIPFGRHSATVSHRDVLMHMLPEVNVALMRRLDARAPPLLVNLDSKSEQNGIKIGVLLCRAGQSTEEEMYNNQHSSPLFDQFLNVIGTKIKLEGFDQFRAGLDVRGNSTGTESVFTTHREHQIMFHVSTLLPYSTVNKQQVDRKRHIGNDVITIIFQEPGAGQFSPALSGVRSQFQHIFVIVRAHVHRKTGQVHYALSTARAKCVPEFGPELPVGPVFPPNDLFRDFLLTKLTNGHLACPKVGKFGSLGKEMRQKYLINLLENNQTDAPVEGASSRFSILPFRRTEKRRNRIPAEIESRGALCWPVEMLVDRIQRGLTLAVSHECVAIIVTDHDVATELNRVPGTALFAIPPRAILGWTQLGEVDLIVYYGQGDSFHLTVKRRHSNDLSDLIARLESASKGKSGLYNPAIATKDVTVTRASQGGQLGFHVSYEGFVNQVDIGSAAARSGLNKGSKIVALQGKSLSELTHEEMIGILRNESIVNLRVLPPIGLKAQHRFTPRELSNSIPRIPVLEPEALAMFDEIEDLPLEHSITPNSTMSTEEQMITDIQRSHAEIANSLRHSNHVKLRQPKKRPNCSPKRQKELFEIKRKSFEAAEKRLSSSGPSEELPRVLSRDSSPIRTVSPAVVVPVAPSRNERRSWHGGPMGGKCPEGLTAAELLNLDKFEHSPNDTASSGERKPAFRSPLKLQTKSTPEATRRPMPRHVLSINRPRNEIVFFKANPSSQVKHPPSRRKETARRNRSVPRSSDKVTQDLLKLITEPVTPLVRHQQHQAESTDDDQSPKKDNPEHLPEADRQYVSLYNGSSESPQLRQGRNKQRRKSLQSDPVTDERLHRIEKTLREMQLKLDEFQKFAKSAP